MEATTKFYETIEITNNGTYYIHAKDILGNYFKMTYIIMMVVVGILFILKIKIKKPDTKTLLIGVIIGIIMFILMVK